MRVAIVVSGSRGDFQPMLALAVGLRAAGHDAIVCASPDNARRALAHGCTFVPIGEPLRDNPALGAWGVAPFSRYIRRQIRLQARDLPSVLAGCDRVVASGLVWGVRPVAELLRIPYRFVAFMPPGFIATTRDPAGVRLVRAALSVFADLAYGSALDRARARLGLPRARGVMAQMLGSDPIVATDPALTVLPDGTRLLGTQTGYPLLPSREGLSAGLRRFLEVGPPPIYAGFGSMPLGDPARVGRLLVEAAQRAGQRLIVSRGWAGIPGAGSGDALLFVEEEPHDKLFPMVRAVIHHGGAGTVASAARAGVPQIVLPQAADQFLWRGNVVRLGLGPRAPMLRLASAASLAKAIAEAIGDPTYRQRATEIADRLRAAPDGVAATVAEITGTASVEA